MPAACPEEFRRRAVSLVVDEGVPVARVAKDLGTAESGLRCWVDRQLAEAGRKSGGTGDDRDGLVRLHRENRVLRMARDLLSRAKAFFAKENVLPPGVTFAFIDAVKALFPVAFMRDRLGVSRAANYAWPAR